MNGNVGGCCACVAGARARAELRDGARAANSGAVGSHAGAPDLQRAGADSAVDGLAAREPRAQDRRAVPRAPERWAARALSARVANAAHRRARGARPAERSLARLVAPRRAPHDAARRRRPLRRCGRRGGAPVAPAGAARLHRLPARLALAPSPADRPLDATYVYYRMCILFIGK